MIGDVLLVGSVPFDTVEEVMRTCGTTVGDRVLAVPDGEIGLRSTWIGALPHMSYEKCPDLEPVHVVAPEDVKSPDHHGPDLLDAFATFRLRPGVTETSFELHFGPEAIRSYAVFTRLRSEGVIPEGVRFQVSIPFTSDATDIFFPEPADREIVTRAYETSVQRMIREILEHVPADDLVIQWDYCSEVLHCIGAFDAIWPPAPGDTPEARFERYTNREYVAPLSQGIPDEVMLGYHICFGTWGGWPIGRVLDIGLCVRLAGALVANTPHRVDFVHLPSMPDPAPDYFRPLADLDIGDTKVFLGIELSDGLDALMRRAQMAREHLPQFGLAHYCGYGREEPARVRELLTEIRDGAERLAAGSRA